MTLHSDLERDIFGAESRVTELRRELSKTTNEYQRNVLKLRLQDAHQEHQRLLQALFASDRVNRS